VIGNRAALVALSIALAAPAAWAQQGPSAADQTLAQTLFDEAVKLMDEGRFADACPKLAESQRLDPGGGTLLNLGFCRQNEGKLASAWAAYNEALSQAIKDGRKDREATARVHVDELEGKVAKLAIDVSDAARKVDQIAIKLDGTPVRQAAWGVLSPIDRGTHAIVVTAPGKLEYKATVDVNADGTVQRVSIPALKDAPIVETPHLGSEKPSHTQAIVGWVTGAVGVAMLGVGITTGALAIDARQKSNATCIYPQPGGTQCDQAGYDWNERAKTYAWLSDFGVGLGVAAIATGIILIATAPKAPRVVPVLTGDVAGAAVIGRF
jgi:hypothetical protein